MLTETDILFWSHLAMAQNYQPPKWMVFLLNMIRNLWVTGTKILSQTHCGRGVQTFFLHGAASFCPLKSHRSRYAAAFGGANPGLGRSCRPGLVGKRHPWCLGPVCRFLGPLERSTRIHKKISRSSQQVAPGYYGY